MTKLLFAALAASTLLCACAPVDPGYELVGDVAFRPGCDALVMQTDESAVRLGCQPGFVPRQCSRTVTGNLTVTNCF